MDRILRARLGGDRGYSYVHLTTLLVRRPSAADIVALAGDEARVVGGQEVHHRGHLLRPTHPPHRDQARHVLDGLRSELPEQRRGLLY